MTPIDFSRRYRFDPRIVDGSYFSGAPLPLEPGDVVGVELLNLGGPRRRDDVEPFLYNLFMDPAIIDIPLKGMTRHLLCKLISTLRAKKVATDYARIDPEGGSPINPRTEAQAGALQRALQDGFGAPKFDLESMKKLMLSNRHYGGELIRDDLVATCRAANKPKLAAACDALAKWDLKVNLDSRGAHLRIRSLSSHIPMLRTVRYLSARI